MKKIRFVLVALMVLFVTSSFAQVVKTDSINIKVGFHCANGKALLEKELGKIDGVSYAFANVDTKVVTIKYDAAKQNKEKLVAAIEKIGYTTEFTKEGTQINKACSHDKETRAIIKIKVNFHCANGKALLDKELAKVEGVFSAVADVATKIVTIEYNTNSLNQEKLVAAIEKIGYTTEFSKKDTEIKKACTHD